MKKSLLLLLSGVFCIFCSAQKYELLSPDGKLKAEIEINLGIFVNLIRGGSELVRLENLSLETTVIGQQNSKYKVQKATRKSVNEIIKPEIREKASELVNAFNELEIRFRADYAITFRLFNEGLAYRFSTSLKEDLIIERENLDIMLTANDSARFQSSEGFNSPYETPYEFKSLEGIEIGKLCNLPFLVEKENGSFLMITEADLYNYPGLWLKGSGDGKLTATNPPYPETFTREGNAYGQGQVAGAFRYIARVKGNRTFPWRIFAVADEEKDLISNNLVYLLASPCAIPDVSWIKPGVVMFDWWAKHNIYGVDFKSGINTETAKYFIDFCAEHGFRYFLFDDGWCAGDNILKPVPGLNMEEVTSYARSKGVDVMLWVIWRTLERQWDEAFSLFELWGIKGIKADFMNRDDQLMVQFYERVARTAAEKKMVVDFHGAYKPCGLRRKYPNVLTREALIEFEYNGWTDQANPDHHNLLPYIRMFAGPMDYIPASMRNSTKDNFRALGDYPMEQGTRAHSMALFVILNSPMTMLPDSPSDYYREKECTEFLTKIPVEWDETRLLAGEIAKYTVLARRSGKNWFVGAITNWNKRDLDLKTDFLAPGRYKLEAFIDGLNADKRAEDYRKIEMVFNAGDNLKINLAPGGGWVAIIKAEKLLAEQIKSNEYFSFTKQKALEIMKSGFNAGDGYREVWIRDYNTFIELAAEVHPSSELRENLMVFFRMQGEDGNIIDGFTPIDTVGKVAYDFYYTDLEPRYAGHKNSVETDQESSLVQAVYKYIQLTSDASILSEQVAGKSVAERLEWAMQYLIDYRFNKEYGLIIGATTADWGDVQPEHGWGVDWDENTHPAIDIYDNAMFIIALDNLIEMVPSAREKWLPVKEMVSGNVRKYLWDEKNQKFIPHIYLEKGSPFPDDFDENQIYYFGGTAIAIEAGLLSKDEIKISIDEMVKRVQLAGAASIGLTLYPPYPEDFFVNKIMNPEYSYQNGGDWTWFGGRMIQQLIRYGFVQVAYEQVQPMVKRVNDNKGFYEWYSVNNEPRGSGTFRGEAGVLFKAILMFEDFAAKVKQNN